MGREKRKEINKKATDLCQIIELLQEPFQTYGFDFTKYSECDRSFIGIARRFFSLKTYDLLILCLFIERKLSSRSGLTLDQIVKHFQLTLSDCIELNQSLQHLRKKHLIVTTDRSFRSDSDEYSLSQSCLNAILTYDRSLVVRKKTQSFESFLREFDNLARDSREYSEEQFSGVISSLMAEYSSVQEIKWLRLQKFTKQDELLLCLATRSHILYGESLDIENALKVLSGDSFSRYHLEKELLSGSNRLIAEDYLAFDSVFFISVDLKLTGKTLAGMCSEIEGVKKSFIPRMCTLIHFEKIKDEYYQHNDAGLGMLEKMISRDNYLKIKQKVPGLIILLSGEPGVGKTSFVHHLARKTGRPVLSANIATILSKYVGESEQNILKLFEELELANKQLDVTPIVIFDEGETLLFSRSTTSSGAVDQMNNNLISLLLQCLDKFNGILIFTSNFDFSKGSFDPALHRRFHSVISVQAPSKEVLEFIFASHFPDFTGCFAKTFLNQYPFVTPAQIKNLKEKFEVQQMLDNSGNPEDLFSDLAKTDLGAYMRTRKNTVGFQ